jgi:uncharacterized membrane protein
VAERHGREQRVVPGGAYDAVELRLLVTPPAGTAPGEYPLAVTAVSQADSRAAAAVAGTLDVGDRGVALTLMPAARTVSYGQTVGWDLTVTNTGSVPDTFDLTAAGVIAPWTTLSASSVTLAPGQSQVVAATAADLGLLPGATELVIAAVSQANGGIAAEARAAVTVTAVRDVALSWSPASQTITGTVATFGLVIDNIGSALADAAVSVVVDGGSVLASGAQVAVPAGSGALIPITVAVPGTGVYAVEATVVLAGGVVRTATAELVVDREFVVYMPFVINR